MTTKKNSDDNAFMLLALEQAQKGIGQTGSNPVVGAVIVKNNKIISTGYHKVFGGPHAEINALSAAQESVKNATMYVTLEPCSHFGKTPPCVNAIIKAKIKRVVVGMTDPNPKVNGKGIKILREHGIEVKVGVLRKKCQNLNEVFIRQFQKKFERPFVTLKMAQTIDGRICDHKGDSKWITGSKSREFVHRIRSLNPGILTGISTVLYDDPSLTSRIPKGMNPTRIVLDSNLKISPKSKLIQNNNDKKTIIFCADKKTNDKKRKQLESLGVSIYPAPVKKGGLDLHYILNKLFSLGIYGLLVEAGQQIASSFLRESLVDKAHIFIAPKILGNGKSSIHDCGQTDIKNLIDLQTPEIQTFGNDVLISGYINPRR